MYAGSPSKHRLHPSLVMPPRPLDQIVNNVVNAVGFFHYGNEPSPARPAYPRTPNSPSKSRTETKAPSNPVLWDTHAPPETDSSIQLQYKPVVTLSPDEASSVFPEHKRKEAVYSLSAELVTGRSPSLPSQEREISYQTPLQTFAGERLMHAHAVFYVCCYKRAQAHAMRGAHKLTVLRRMCEHKRTRGFILE